MAKDAKFKPPVANTRVCPKCGGRQWRYTHHATPTSAKEWLQVACDECGWSYPMACRDEKTCAKKG